ncbi:cytochrome c biogenesis protein ResB [Paucibacter sp. DJ2R-2]|uniref:cytochrome c biogenesis protein ResB n=1 Tax=Paucibacter sp. DJ2R-2 TaxID=2893558 RepID=UPI0021E37BC2|nr:cytochrome c biogenesis protein ResB [Paucibacter sp. DJ2R-2]
MPFAVAVLAVVAVAASIGSLVEQNQPFALDVGRYGLIWASSYRLIGLHDIYHAPWFLALLGFLTVSTGLCVWRHTPGMWRESRGFKHHLNADQLARLPVRAQLNIHADLQAQVLVALRAGGWRWRGEGLTISAKKGQVRRLGYIATHLAIVVISVGGLVDANLGLQVKLASGRADPAPMGRPPAELSASSRLRPDAGAFRGAMRLVEGQADQWVSLNLSDGYLLRQLPVTVRLVGFRIETHPGGQPRDFVSDIEINDPAVRSGPVPLRVSMNAPAHHGRLRFYQSGFDDGGSVLRGTWLLRGGVDSRKMQAQVGQPQSILVDGQPQTAEFTGYKPRNLVSPEASASRSWRETFLSGSQAAKRVDLGPSVELRLRDSSGQIQTETVFLRPLTFDGRQYSVFGVMDGQSEQRYLRIPVGSDGTLHDYRQLLGALQDPATTSQLTADAPKVVAQALPLALQQFLNGGFARVGDANTQRVLVELLSRYAMQTWIAQHPEQTPADALTFVSDALLAYSHWAEAGKPPLVQVDEVRPVAASVLQVSEAPGEIIVYAGMALLALGVTLMVLCPERRLWVREVPGGVMFALAAHRPLDGLNEELLAFLDPMRKESV